MSLYDDIDGVPLKENNSSETAGWSSGFSFMQQQLKRQKFAQPKTPSQLKSSRPTGLAKQPNSSKDILTSNDENKDPDTSTEPFVQTEASIAVVVDEYDPMKPNDYEECKQKQREKEQRERELERSQRDKDYDDRYRERGRDRGDYRSRDRRRRRYGDDDDDDEPRSLASRKSGAAIAPPVSLTAPSNADDDSKPFSGVPSLFSKPDVGFDSPVASNIMAKYGWKDGQGLGKQEQGINQCLQVEKTSKRGGKIINQEKDVSVPQENESLVGKMKNPSKVILLRNMVGPGEVDDELEPETAEECSKYGEVHKVVIYEVREGVPEDEAVRIFVEFKKMDSAIKAIIDLNGRYFGGRTVKAGFYNLDKFRRFDLLDDLEFQ
ncbi:splicing factor 45-like [Dendronephthya gigantea]|uniref:splicing factor 45-like n=1 Tax=Dendronephthya gigantea TaxID=151771 RepID=UPI00106D19F2|nr:splicing factor 45-like [Dendronephthya gigantea]XP_028398025.1 splicing factor 45-like [Dendronephthya gigantea]